ncbi:unnamed protein product [Prunus armeniaca]|uniref:Uncharacterized protein n=1 Tax=Prunus armeniaca TaxID=36596 RepID=A0A6J5TZA7_PRUAR|nr:unnamed protein product [Prunus armeniaca]
MFHFIFKTSLHLQQTRTLNANIRSLTTLSIYPALTDYLTNTLAFTPESALQVSKKIHGRPPNNPYPVHSLFEHYGFTPTHIAKIITICPSFLWANPEKTLKPKLDFLAQNGIYGQDLVSTITNNPRILERSLNKQIAPCIGFLKSFLGSASALLSHFSVKRGTAVVLRFSDSMGANAETLRQHGVPHSNIIKMIACQPRIFSRDVEVFSKIVREVEELGFNPLSMMFIHGVCTLFFDEEGQSFGWSEAEFQALFLKQPPVMRSSEERLKRALDFFMNKMGWGTSDILKYPVLLCLSFEKRVLPRWSILQVLIAKGVITKSKKTTAKAFMQTEDKFVSEFVNGYEEHAPELLEMYQKKLQEYYFCTRNAVNNLKLDNAHDKARFWASLQASVSSEFPGFPFFPLTLDWEAASSYGLGLVGWMAGAVLILVIKEFEVGFDPNNKLTMSSWPTSPFKTGLSFQGGFKFWESRRFHVDVIGSSKVF